MMNRLLYLIIIVAGIYVFCIEGDAEAQMVRLAQYEVLPLTSQSLPDGGFACRIAREAFGPNHNLKINWYPIKRAFSLIETGGADVSLGWIKNEERKDKVIFSDQPLIDTSIIFFYLKNRLFDWENLEDLYGLRIGYIIGGISMPEDLIAAAKKGSLYIERVATEKQNLKKLLAGRIDIMVGSTLSTPFTMEAILTPEERARVVAHPKALLEGRYYAIFSKKLPPHLIHAFNSGIDRLRENGQYKQWLTEGLYQEQLRK